ncbi:hypothetical protein POUND7_006850 [Theobroma cacao]
MATDASPRSPMREMSLERQDAGQGEDRISSLPDDVLVHILSFIPTKEAVRTSVLSTRWKNLWISLPNLTFEDPDPIEDIRASSLKVVDRSLHHRSACKRKLSPILQKEVDEFDLSPWPSAVMRLLIKPTYVTLPDCLFTSESLISLVLRSHCTLKVPTPVRFPSLKVLKLSGVRFKDEQSCQELFSGCLVLEELVLEQCDWNNIDEIYIDIPTLTKFSLSNYKAGLIKDGNCKIKVNAANLSHLSFRISLLVQLVPYNPILPVLDTAQVDIFGFINRGENYHCAMKLLAGLQNANSLSVNVNSLRLLDGAENIEAGLPTFHNLTHLHVRPDHYFPGAYTVGALMYLLQKAPKLETLSIVSGFKPQDQDRFFQTLPCFSSCLKSFAILCFEATAASIQLLKHLCQHAPVLKEISLFYICDLKDETQYQVLQVLGDSKRVEIGFYPVKLESSISII